MTTYFFQLAFKFLPFFLILLYPSLGFSFSKAPSPSSETKPIEKKKEAHSTRREKARKMRIIQTNFDAAHAMIESIDNEKKRNKEWHLFAIECAKHKEDIYMLQALRALNNSTDRALTIYTFSEVLSELVQLKEYGLIPNTIDVIHSAQTKNLVLSQLVSILVSSNDMLANEFLNQITDPVIKARTLKQLAYYYLKKNNLKDAQASFNAIGVLFEQDSARVYFAEFYAKEKAQDLVEETLSAIQNTNLKETALLLLVSEYAKQKEFTLAFQVANQLQNTSNSDKALISIIKEYAAEKKFKSAFQLTDHIEDPVQQLAAKEAIVSALADLQLFDSALQVMNSVDDDTKTASMRYDIALGYAKNNQLEEAISLLENINDPRKKKESLMSLARFLGQLKDFYFPLLNLEKIAPPSLQQDVLSAFVISYAQHHSLSELKRALSAYLDNDKTCQVILSFYIEEKQLSDALDFISGLSDTALRLRQTAFFAQSSLFIEESRSQQRLLDDLEENSESFSSTDAITCHLIASLYYKKMENPKKAHTEFEKGFRLIRKEKETLSTAQFQSIFSLLLQSENTLSQLQLISFVADKQGQIKLLSQMTATRFSDKERKLLRSIVESKKSV